MIYRMMSINYNFSLISIFQKKEVIENGKYVKKKVHVDNKLLEDVKRWGNWVLDEAKKDVGQFYPKDSDGSIPVGYIWARTIPCHNPSWR